MSIARQKMKIALADWVAPHLRSKGFTGTFPNYLRFSEKQIDIVTFQFSLFDHVFSVNIAKCPPDGITYLNGETVPAEMVNAHYCPVRLRLGVSGDNIDHWFKFNPRPQELNSKECHSSMSVYNNSLLKYKYIADDVIELLEKQAETWWQESAEWWQKGVPGYNRLFVDIQRLITGKQ